MELSILGILAMMAEVEYMIGKHISISPYDTFKL